MIAEVLASLTGDALIFPGFQAASMFARIFRFNDSRFWLMVALNVLNAMLVYAMQTKPFTAAAQLGIGMVALINALVGMWLLAQLAREPIGGASRAALEVARDTPVDPQDHADREHDAQKDGRG
jgi:hypothetical protein